MPTTDFITTNTVIGKVCTAHIEPIHKGDEENKSIITKLLNENDVVMGDFNSTYYQLQVHEAVTVEHATLEVPSYLPYCEDSHEMYPPAFDKIVYKAPLTGKLRRTRWFLPKIIKGNPRDFMTKIKWCSDHIPVMGEVSSSDHRIILSTFNCCDPFYFGTFWENASKGFRKEDEDNRLGHVLNTIKWLVSASDIVGLQEVPYQLLSKIEEIDNSLHIQKVATPSACHDKEDKDIYTKCSYIVVITKKDIIKI